MIRVPNGKIIHKLSNRSLKANRLRNIIAVSAIALTAILFTTLFTLGIGTIENFQKATMRQSGGGGHATLKHISDENFNRVKNHKLIKEIAYNRMLCDGVKNEEFLKRKAEFWYLDDTALRLRFCEPTSGHKPLLENEIITDTKTLMLLGVPQEIGAPVKLRLNIRGLEVQREFKLAGWWESDPAFSVGTIVASRAYVDKHPEELKNTFKKDYSYTGVINADMMFRNSLDLQGKLNTVITDSGYSLDKSASNYLDNNVNWAYLTTNVSMDAGTMIALIGGLLLIIFTGYLIIYNVFQISVIRDIQFYGLLKTIGTTGRQIRRILRRQALLLSAAGIPIGLLIGFFVGKSLVPLIVNRSSYAGTTVNVSPSPWIFIGSALFAFVTVLISIYKPGRIAAAVSPIEAVRYTEGGTKHSGRLKKSKKGGRSARMALSNLGRNKKRTMLVGISLSLSMVLLNTVFTLSQGIDMDKYLSKFVDTDFLIAHAEYFQNHFSESAKETTQSIINAVGKQPGFEKGGRLYGGRSGQFTSEDEKNPSKIMKDEYGHFYSAVYGLEDIPMQRLELLDGELDYEKLASGKYILEGVHLDDYGVPEMDEAHFAVGDTVTLRIYEATYEKYDDRKFITQKYTVLGHVKIKTFSNSDRTYSNYTFYLPADVYKHSVAKPAVMSYVFNVEDGYEAEMESFLKNYTERVEPLMNYTSKMTSLNEFKGMRDTVVMIGGALSFIIGLVGVLNFINAILTSILTRRREFAMLQSIGMTRSQLRGMLCYEGVYYAVGTSALSFVFGTVFSIFVLRAFCAQLWFFSYQFTIWPMMIVLPFLLILGIAIPLVSYAMTDRQSIVERLRAVE